MSILFKVPLEDHPRMCGEQVVAVWEMRSRPGSPPRVRGTDCDYPPTFGDVRITPACAGNRQPGDAGGGTDVGITPA